MKKNYKVDEDVEITKPGIYEGLQGKIITNNPGTEFKPLSVDLGPYGKWQFKYEEVKPLKEEKEQFAFDKPSKSAKANKPKRSYNKKAK